LDEALELATTSQCKQWKHGAIIRKGGRILGRGINSDRNNPNLVSDPKTQAAVHAEVAALRAAGSTDLRGATIFVARANKQGIPRMSKPCPNCQTALRERGVKKVIYTVDSSMEI
jgi:deoxycytidylate deaminase